MATPSPRFHIKCAQCKAVLGDASKFCFMAEADPRIVHFICKPEQCSDLEQVIVFREQHPGGAQCRQCQNPIGTTKKLQARPIFCLKAENVLLQDRSITKWKNVREKQPTMFEFRSVGAPESSRPNTSPSSAAHGGHHGPAATAPPSASPMPSIQSPTTVSAAQPTQLHAAPPQSPRSQMPSHPAATQTHRQPRPSQPMAAATPPQRPHSAASTASAAASAGSARGPSIPAAPGVLQPQTDAAANRDVLEFYVYGFGTLYTSSPVDDSQVQEQVRQQLLHFIPAGAQLVGDIVSSAPSFLPIGTGSHLFQVRAANCMEVYERLRREWTFAMPGALFLTEMQSHLQSEGSATKNCTADVAVGFLTDPNTFVKKHALRQCSVSWTASALELDFKDPAFKMTFPTSYLMGFALQSPDSVSSEKVTIFVPYTQPPRAADDANNRIVSSLSRDSAADTLSNVAESAVLAITVENRYLATLKKISGFTFLDTRVDINDIQTTTLFKIPAGRGPPAHEQQHICWYLSVIAADKRHSLSCEQWTVLLDISMQVGNSASNAETIGMLRHMHAMIRSTPSYWVSLDSVFSIAAPTPVPGSAKISLPDVPDNHRLVKRLSVTPSSLLPIQSAVMKCSRLLRGPAKDLDVVIVSFADEQGEYLDLNQPTEDRIRNVLCHGFLLQRSGGLTMMAHGATSVSQSQLSGAVHYQFLCVSNSQLRTRKAIFVAGADPRSIREQIVPPSICRQISAHKYMSCLALFCTSDVPTVTVSGIVEITDVKTVTMDTAANPPSSPAAAQPHLLTDGAGFISEQQLASLAQYVPKCKQAAAVQVRIGGLKGVLAKAPVPSSLIGTAGLSNDNLVVRESMKKFDNADKMLCVVRAASYSPVTLNREIINLLSSLKLRKTGVGSWDPTPRLLELQQLALEKSCASLKCESEAANALKPICDAFALQHDGFSLLFEPFWLSLLRNKYLRSIAVLRKKSQIPVEDGCYLMGIPDASGQLKDNQVYVRIRQPGKEPRCITGSVIVYRNPCLHPGDVRIVTAVEFALYPGDVENVIVFPLVGSPLVHFCGGGDLDGDCFSVIWDKGLVPPREYQYEGLDYDRILREAKEKMTRRASASSSPHLSEADSLVDAYIRVIQGEALGRLANMHLALCDMQVNGALDELAIELAKSHSLSVDFAKTGIMPMVPKAAKDKVDEFPDFMQKGDKDSYISEKPLGQLYRQCLSFPDDIEDELRSQSSFAATVGCDRVLLLDGHELHRAWAAQLLGEYAKCVQLLLIQCGLRCEAELFFGAPRGSSDKKAGEDGEQPSDSDVVQTGMNHLAAKFRALYRCYADKQSDPLAVASACYAVVYDCGSMSRSACLSFPWIVCGSSLVEMKRVAKSEPGTEVWTAIGASCDITTDLELLPPLVEQYDQAVLWLQSRLQALWVTVQLGGSAAAFCGDCDSDVDVYLLADASRVLPNAQQILAALQPVSAADSWKFEVSDVDRSLSTMHVLRGSLVNCQDGSSVVLSVRAPPTPSSVPSLYAIVRLVYEQRLEALFLFRMVFQWARQSGILLSEANAQQLGLVLSSEELIALILHHLSPPEDLILANGSTVSSSPPTSPLSPIVSSLCSAERLKPHRAGQVLLDFFKSISEAKADFRWRWSGGEIVIPKEHVDWVAQCGLQALHFLMLSRSWEHMISRVAQNSTERKLDRYLSPKLSNFLMHWDASHGFQRFFLEKTTGCKISLFSPCNGRIHLVATGNQWAIRELQKKLYDLQKSQSARFPYMDLSQKFMADSMLILFRGSSLSDRPLEEQLQQRVVFTPYTGPEQPLHVENPRHYVRLENASVGASPGGRGLPAAAAAAAAAAAVSAAARASTDPRTDENLENTMVHCFIGAVKKFLEKEGKGKDTPKMWLEIQFGVFYVMKVEAGYNKQPITTVGHLLAAVQKKNAKRAQFSQRRTPLTASTAAQFVRAVRSPPKVGVSVPIISQRKGGKPATKPVKTKLNNPINVSCGFFPTVSLHAARLAEAGPLLDKVERALLSAGFKRGPPDDQSTRSVFKLSFNLDKSHSFKVRMNNAFEVRDLAEQPLVVHQTELIHFANPPRLPQLGGSESTIFADHDIRFKASARQSLEDNEDLVKECLYPLGVSRPPLEYNAEGRPVVAAHFRGRPEADDMFNHLRHVAQLRLFEFAFADPSFPAVCAKIMAGTRYDNKGLTHASDFIELKLQVEELPSQWVTQMSGSGAADPAFHRWAKQVVHLALRVSDELRQAALPVAGPTP